MVSIRTKWFWFLCKEYGAFLFGTSRVYSDIKAWFRVETSISPSVQGGLVVTVELSPQYELFAQHYAADFNASRAAIRAGYSPNGAGVQGFRLLKNAKISERIREIRDEIADSLDISEKRIIQEYAKIAFTNLEDVVDWFNRDPSLRDATDISPPAHGAVSEILVTETRIGEDMVKVATKIKLHSKQNALDSLARYRGMFTERIDLNATVEGSFSVEFTGSNENKDTS